MDPISNKINRMVMEVSKNMIERIERKDSSTSNFEKVRLAKQEQAQLDLVRMMQESDRTVLISAREKAALKRQLLNKVSQVERGKEATIFAEDLQRGRVRLNQLGEMIDQVRRKDQSQALKKGLEYVEAKYFEIDRLLQQIPKGKGFSVEDLLNIQAKIYSLTMNIEVLSRVVDKVVSGVKTILQTHV